MNINEYFNFLLVEIKDREKTLTVLRGAGVHRLDLNYQAVQGYLFCLVKVVRDLATILDTPLSENFYPDSIGFLEGKLEGDV